MTEEIMDFSDAKNAKDDNDLSARVNRQIESLAEREEGGKRPWPVLSPSMLNGVCDRRVAYGYFDELEAAKAHRAAVAEGKSWERHPKFPGKMLRIFDQGHRDEQVTLGELQKIGFRILTTDEEGKQFGFRMCYEGKWARLRGRIDGIVVESPLADIKTPCLWEHKALNHKTSTAMKSGGLQKTKPNYYQQVQIYMPYMALHENPCMFTWRNKDNAQLGMQLVEFDPAEANKASEILAKVLAAKRPEELTRCADSMTHHECRWCDFKDKCWTAAAAPAITMDPISRPEWL